MNHNELFQTNNGINYSDQIVDKNSDNYKFLVRQKELIVKTWNIGSGVFVKAAMALPDEAFYSKVLYFLFRCLQ